MQIARAFGASDIIAVDVQDDKLQKAKLFGATHTINAKQEDAIEKIRVCVLSLSLTFYRDKSSSSNVFFSIMISTFEMEALLPLLDKFIETYKT